MTNLTIMLITMGNFFAGNRTALAVNNNSRLADLQFSLDQLNFAVNVCHRNPRMMEHDWLKLHDPDEEALMEKCKDSKEKAKRVRVEMEVLDMQ
jgi:hypothetical protein